MEFYLFLLLEILIGLKIDMQYDLQLHYAYIGINENKTYV